jgi:hypothetical protein
MQGILMKPLWCPNYTFIIPLLHLNHILIIFLIISVKKAPTPSATFGKKNGVFGSMTVEELKSKGFVRESVQKVYTYMDM